MAPKSQWSSQAFAKKSLKAAGTPATIVAKQATGPMNAALAIGAESAISAGNQDMSGRTAKLVNRDLAVPLGKLQLRLWRSRIVRPLNTERNMTSLSTTSYPLARSAFFPSTAPSLFITCSKVCEDSNIFKYAPSVSRIVLSNSALVALLFAMDSIYGSRLRRVRWSVSIAISFCKVVFSSSSL